MKPSPNQPCSCGSGKKFKKCCGSPSIRSGGGVDLPHTPTDRAFAFAKLDAYVNAELGEDRRDAHELFWEEYLEHRHELPDWAQEASCALEDMWFALDFELRPGVTPVDRFLAAAHLTAGERSFLISLRQTSIRLYEVIDLSPGVSLTLRDVFEREVVTVQERTASRSLSRGDLLAARIIPRGVSGRPEMERGLVQFPGLARAYIETELGEERDWLRDEDPRASPTWLYGELVPSIHCLWLESFFDPFVPQQANTDGEVMTITRSLFDVADPVRVARAFTQSEAEGIEPMQDGASWSWGQANRDGKRVTVAHFAFEGDLLRVETNSVARGQRARELVERLCGEALAHRSTTHEDMQRLLKEHMREVSLGRTAPDREDGRGEEGSPTPLDPDVAEALVGQLYGVHYREWVDVSLPALDGLTPREAAKRPALRTRLEALLMDLKGAYERGLKLGQPAYDPSWIYVELELGSEQDRSNAPLLAHERVAEGVPGSAEASRASAERIRARPGFSDATTTVSDEELRSELDLRRFLQGPGLAANDAGQEGALAAPYLPLMVNLDLHRRKIFWVDAALSFMLEHTDVSTGGVELRTPFPSFALVFTDRHALALAERLLARRPSDPAHGHLLRVMTVYVRETDEERGRTAGVTLALDAGGADLPSLVRFEVPTRDDHALQQFFADLGPLPPVNVPDANPARGLLRLILNAILYATSAGVTPEERPLRSSVRTRTPKGRGASATDEPDNGSERVFFLPGKIDIRQVRQLETLRRAPEGKSTFARFMVRGHWRKPAASWKEQRPRWIEPYWKGPDLAQVIEKAYRLKP